MALLLHLAVPGLTAMPPLPPPADLQALQDFLGDYAVELCSHADDSGALPDNPTSPAPRHHPGHDCVACCSPASLAAVVPLAVPLPLPGGAAVVETVALTAFGPARSIYAARQRGPPGPPLA